MAKFTAEEILRFMDNPDILEHIFPLNQEIGRYALNLCTFEATPELVAFVMRQAPDPEPAYMRIIKLYDEGTADREEYTMDDALIDYLAVFGGKEVPSLVENTPDKIFNQFVVSSSRDDLHIDRVYERVKNMSTSRPTRDYAAHFEVDPVAVDLLRQYTGERFSTALWMHAAGVSVPSMLLATDLPEEIYRSVFKMVEHQRREEGIVPVVNQGLEKAIRMVLDDYGMGFNTFEYIGTIN